MKELKIIIAGEANTGKSTLLTVVEKLLKEQGYDVEVMLEGTTELLDYGDETRFRNAMAQNVDKRLEALRNTKITVCTQQLQRGSQR